MKNTSNRGVSPVLGFVLLIGVLVVAFGLWNVNVIPSIASSNEFDSHQDVSTDMNKFLNELIESEQSDIPSTTEIRTETNYNPAISIGFYGQKNYQVHSYETNITISNTGMSAFRDIELDSMNRDNGEVNITTNNIELQPQSVNSDFDSIYLENGYTYSHEDIIDSPQLFISDTVLYIPQFTTDFNSFTVNNNLLLEHRKTDLQQFNITNENFNITLQTGVSEQGWERTIEDMDNVRQYEYTELSKYNEIQIEFENDDYTIYVSESMINN